MTDYQRAKWMTAVIKEQERLFEEQAASVDHTVTKLTMDDIEVAISRMEQAIKKQNGKKRTEFGYVL